MRHNYLGYKTEERKILVQELKKGIADGSITEAFGAGTAALISPISVVGIEGTDFALPAYDANSIMFRLKKRLNDIRHGLAEDIYAWNTVI